MLALAPTAVEAVKNIVESSPISNDTGGIRIVAEPAGGAPALRVEVADVPDTSDVVVEQEGARVYLETEAASVLDGKVLDATVDANGRVGFQVIDAEL